MSANGKLKVISEDEEITTKDFDNGEPLRYNSGSDVIELAEYVEIPSQEHKHLAYLTQKLLDELDALGLCNVPLRPKTHKDIYMNVVINGFSLVNCFRKLLVQMSKNNVAAARVKDANLKLEKQADVYRKQALEKEEQMELMSKKIIMKDLDHEELRKKVAEMEKEWRTFRRQSTIKERDLTNKIKSLEQENKNLKNLAEKQSVKNEASALELLEAYKTNEETYKNVIKKLQENNQGLLAHLVNLRQDLRKRPS